MLTGRETIVGAYMPPTASGRIHHWFRSGDDWCAAAWHGAATPSARVAVLCPSIAQEHLRGQRPYRALARRLAAAGVGTLRFDYPATGNSTGVAIDDAADGPDLTPRWSAAIRDAVAHARALVPGAEVFVVARRFGALLAVRAIADGTEPVASLVLWDPSLSGHAQLRELKLREAARLDVLFAK
jgi:alpha-beta hydrolase superfamily lysophospholipase